MIFRLATLVLATLLISPLSRASEDKTPIIQDFFKQLEANPEATIQAPPKRFGAPNRLAPAVKTHPQILKSIQSFGEPDHQNKPIRFYPENDFAKDFETLFSPELQTAHLDLDIWSGDYWATYQMGLAKRYLDDSYPQAQSYDKYIEFFRSLGPYDFDDPIEMAKLSPAEKYDLLVRDNKMSLTNWSIFTSQSAYSEEDGEEKAMTWAGLCHGWAAAAFVAPRPEHSVKLDLGFGEIEFLPDDIKALVTLLWARAPVPNRFMGGRCNTADPEKDEFGRIKDPECFDINPASWHTVLINHVGIRKQSFVLDATYDLEVWNQPIKSYEVTYFNPITQTQQANIEDAIAPLSEHEKDIFKKYRSPKAKSLVGVMLQIRYLVETAPRGNPYDNSDRDALQTVQYFYDIELDENRELVGGEWYHAAHPDFIWAPIEGATAKSFYDQMLTGSWDENQEVPPQNWLGYAHQSSRQGIPLASVVNELIRRSRLPQSPIEKE